MKVSRNSTTETTDLGLTNGQRYGYLVVACFRDPENQIWLSSGVRVEATPVVLPEPIRDLQARKAGRNVILTWTPPKQGRVQIMQVWRLPDTSEGDVVGLPEASRFGNPLRETCAGQAQFTPTSTAMGRMSFYPLSIIENTAVVGRPVSIVNLKDVKGVKAERRWDNIIRLAWAWPDGLDAVRVTWRYDAYPSDANGGVYTEVVRRAAYDETYCWELPRTRSDPHYFKVFTFIEDSDDTIFSKGVEAFVPASHQKRVTYRVVTGRRFVIAGARKARIAFSTKEDVDYLPGLQAVLKKNGLPMDPRDGDIVAECDRLEFNNGQAIMELHACNGTGFVKLFFKDPQAAVGVQLLTPARDRLLLS